MKIAIRSYGTYRDHLDGFGGLELRYTVNYAHFLRSEGHEVHFFDDTRGCDGTFDLALDAPNLHCHLVKSKFHIHSWFSSVPTDCAKKPEIYDNPCYQRGEMLLSSPYKHSYQNALREKDNYNFKHILFIPIPYPDNLLPKNLRPGFDRDVIFWGNKGNFSSEFGPERNMHYITNGINTLKALGKLNKKTSFKTIFALNNYIKETRIEWRDEVASLISQLKEVNRFDQITWTQYLDIMSRTKINTHIGGLTSGINECIFTQSVPAVPAEFFFFKDVAKEMSVMPPTEVSTVEEIYEVYERLWFDEQYYICVRDAFQEAFADHRTTGLRKHWLELQETLGI